MRGISPALILADIERRLRTRGTCGQLHEAFHLIAGTSTGALIALALTMPAAAPGRPACDAGELVDLYRRLGSAIFPGGRRRFPGRLRGVVRCRYGDQALTAILRQVFGERPLGEAFTDLLVPCYDTEERTPRFFEKRRALDPDGWCVDGASRALPAWEAARAATAAPTYFAPAQVGRRAGPQPPFSLIDGGVFANNPGLGAYAAARRLYPEADGVFVLSGGTGVTDRPYTYEQLRSWGSLDWVSPRRGSPLIDVMLDGQSDETVRILDTLPGVRQVRLNPRLDPRRAALDDADPRSLAYLEERARRYIRDNDGLLEEICGRLGSTSPKARSRQAA